MFNILSYVGLSMQSELCLWTLMGLLRTIFDATLFKVNANLKQVWQMRMPPELSKPVQRALRTMISGVMLVQCFTVYVYLASYIVLLYPVFLEERPTLVLPWLLLAAVRKFLCELTSLALGLGACLLLGPGRPPCVKFVVFKVASITPAVYMWMLVYSYYNTLKLSSTFKTLSKAMQSNDRDFGLELAVRRRRTKSLLGENQLRESLVANFNYGERNIYTKEITSKKPGLSSNMIHATNTSEDTKEDADIIQYNHSIVSERMLSDLGEDWGGADMVPRDGDRILEQLVLMLLRISEYKRSDATDPEKLFSSNSRVLLPYNNMDCTSIHEDTDTPPLVGNSKGKTASYLEEYPQIFMKKNSETIQRQNESQFSTLRTVHSQIQMDDKHNSNKFSDHEKYNTPNDTNRRKIFQLSSDTNTVNQGKDSQDTQSKCKEVDFKTGISSEHSNEVVEMIMKTPSTNSFQIEVGKKTGELCAFKNEPEIKTQDYVPVPDANSNTESTNSLQNIIDRMRKSLPPNVPEPSKTRVESNSPISTRGINERNTSRSGAHQQHSHNGSNTAKK